MLRNTAIALACGAMVTGSSASAQTMKPDTPAAAASTSAPVADRVFIYVNGGYQAGSNDFSRTVTFKVYAEDGSFLTNYSVKSAPVFDAGGGLRLWKGLAVGIGVSRYNKSGSGDVKAQVPHPFFFNQMREVDGTAGGLTREETALHLQVLYMVPVGRIALAFFGGPSFFSIKQTLVSAVSYNESYPYDTATFATATTEGASKSVTGFNAGVDVAYMFARNIGVGGGVRYARASTTLTSGSAGDVTMHVGGAQVGAGLRVRF